MLLLRLALRAACACALLSASPPAHAFEGRVSWYGSEHGQANKRTHCDERFRPDAVLAVHWTLPCGTRVRVDDVSTGRSIEVPVRDRGPHPRLHRALDLSRGAAARLGILRRGVIRSRLTVLGPGLGRLRLVTR